MYIGASQYMMRGASESRLGGASEVRLAGASERVLAGASESRLGGASERRLGGATIRAWVGPAKPISWGPAKRGRRMPKSKVTDPIPRLTRWVPSPRSRSKPDANRILRAGSTRHLPFVRHPEDPTVMEEQWLYEAISGTYLPLIQIFEGLQADGVPYRCTVSLSARSSAC